MPLQERTLNTPLNLPTTTSFATDSNCLLLSANTLTNSICFSEILPGVGEDLSPGTYVYDVEISSGASLRYTLLTGNITVTEQVSGAI